MVLEKRCEICNKLVPNLYCEDFNTCPIYCADPKCRKKALEIMHECIKGREEGLEEEKN